VKHSHRHSHGAIAAPGVQAGVVVGIIALRLGGLRGIRILSALRLRQQDLRSPTDLFFCSPIFTVSGSHSQSITVPSVLQVHPDFSVGSALIPYSARHRSRKLLPSQSPFSRLWNTGQSTRRWTRRWARSQVYTDLLANIDVLLKTAPSHSHAWSISASVSRSAQPMLHTPNYSILSLVHPTPTAHCHLMREETLLYPFERM
jgi:hypothetical protein